jgi:acetyltransferase-like isoleucine patch superfamily enzyme
MSKDSFYNKVKIGKNVNIGKNVSIGDNSTIQNNVTIYDNVEIGPECHIRSNVIIGELNHNQILQSSETKTTIIGANSIIGAGTIIYASTIIGEGFRSGNNLVIREDTLIGSHCSIGTSTDIQGRLKIGDYVKIHSNCFIPEGTVIKDFVWIYPSVTLTNDMYPPHGILKPIIVEEYAQIGAGSIVLPNVNIGSNSFVGAGSVVTKDVDQFRVVIGSPARDYCNIEDLLSPEGNELYPWKVHLKTKRGYPWE